jgi:predicted MFS family arabinose efflux permease
MFPLLSRAGAEGWWFCVAAAAFGAANPPVGSLLRAWWMDAVEDRLQQAAHGWENATTEALYASGPLIAALALAFGKLEVLYAAYAAMLLAGVWMCCNADGAGAGTKAAAEDGEAGGEGVPVRRQPGLWPALLCAALWIACYDGAVVGLTALAHDRGVTASAGAWVACLSAGGLIGGLLYGVYARPASRLRRELMAGMLLYACLGGVFLLPGWGVAAACVLIGAASAVPFAGVYVWVDERMVGAGRVAAYQAMSAAMCAGGVVGAAAGGLLVEVAGVQAELLASGGAAVLAAAIAAAAPRVRTVRHA